MCSMKQICGKKNQTNVSQKTKRQKDQYYITAFFCIRWIDQYLTSGRLLPYCRCIFSESVQFDRVRSHRHEQVQQPCGLDYYPLSTGYFHWFISIGLQPGQGYFIGGVIPSPAFLTRIVAKSRKVLWIGKRHTPRGTGSKALAGIL